MNSIKSYPWAEALNISEKHFSAWKEKNTGKNFLYWALTQKILERKKYFNWATDFYNMPIVENVFFEQNLMSYNQWDKVKNLYKWNAEIAPIFVWGDVIFVGCLKKPEDLKSWTFNHRLVLVTDLALRMHWKHVQDCKNITEKQSTQKINTSHALKNKSSLPEPDEDRFSPSEDATPERNSQTESQPFYMKDFTIDLPPEENDPTHKAKYAQMNKAEDKEDAPTKTKVFLDHITAIIKNPLMKKESNQKEEIILNSKVFVEKKVVQTMEVVTNPSVEKKATQTMEAAPSVEKKVVQTMEAAPSMKAAPFVEKKVVQFIKPAPSVAKEEKEDEVTLTNLTDTYFSIKSKNSYDKLFNQTTSNFSATLILENKNNILFPVDWSGYISANFDAKKQVANLNDFSIFKIVGKGHHYHGFVVDTEGNKKFFNNIGWDKYPKHVTAIPIKNEKDQLEFIFIGLAASSLDRQSIQKIEQIVLDYFSNSKIEKKAA